MTWNLEVILRSSINLFSERYDSYLVTGIQYCTIGLYLVWYTSKASFVFIGAWYKLNANPSACSFLNLNSVFIVPMIGILRPNILSAVSGSNLSRDSAIPPVSAGSWMVWLLLFFFWGLKSPVAAFPS